MLGSHNQNFCFTNLSSSFWVCIQLFLSKLVRVSNLISRSRFESQIIFINLNFSNKTNNSLTDFFSQSIQNNEKTFNTLVNTKKNDIMLIFKC